MGHVRLQRPQGTVSLGNPYKKSPQNLVLTLKINSFFLFFLIKKVLSFLQYNQQQQLIRTNSYNNPNNTTLNGTFSSVSNNNTTTRGGGSSKNIAKNLTDINWVILNCQTFLEYSNIPSQLLGHLISLSHIHLPLSFSFSLSLSLNFNSIFCSHSFSWYLKIL